MQITEGAYSAVYGSGTLSVFHPSLAQPAEYVARPFDFVEEGNDERFDCESQLVAAIDYTRRKIVGVAA